MIYLVEDDDSIRELVIYTLRSTGMEAKGFGLLPKGLPLSGEIFLRKTF